MCGISVEPIDLERILYYSSICEKGFVLHKSGIGALIKFLETKSFLYTNIYFHRTIRSFDLHLAEIFEKTLEEIFNINPLDDLDNYLHLTDLSLLGKVSDWIKEEKARDNDNFKEWRKLLLEWKQLFRRRKKWRFICETTEEQYRNQPLHRQYSPQELEGKIRKETKIPSEINIKIDMAKYDNRPVNPLLEKYKILIYYPSKDKIFSKPLENLLKRSPFKTTICRLFIDNRERKYDKKLIKAFEGIIGHVEEEETSNI